MFVAMSVVKHKAWMSMVEKKTIFLALIFMRSVEILRQAQYTDHGVLLYGNTNTGGKNLQVQEPGQVEKF